MRIFDWAAPLVVAAALAGCASSRPELPHVRPDLEYRIGNEDVIEVAVFQAENLSRTIPVRPDGRISIPLLGDVVAEGKTSHELARELEQKLEGYVVGPRVTVIVREVNAPRFFVIGEVARPGTYPLRGNVDVIQALALAGGLGDFASESSIVLIRKTEEGEIRTRIDYDDLVDDEEHRIPILMPGDTLYVP